MYTTYHYGDQNCRPAGAFLPKYSNPILGLWVHTGTDIPDMLSFWLEPPKTRHRCIKVCGSAPQAANALRSLCKSVHNAGARASLKHFEQMFMLRSTLKDFDALENQPSVLVARIDQHFKETQGLPIIIDDVCSLFWRLKGSYYTLIDPHVLRGSTGCVRKFNRENLLSKRSGWMLLFPERKKIKKSKELKI